MALNLKDVKLKVKSKKRKSNVYENTKFVLESVSKKTECDEPQEDYEEINVSMCTDENTTPKKEKAKPNEYTDWKDRKTEISTITGSEKDTDLKNQRETLQLPTVLPKPSNLVTIKWKLLSIAMIPICSILSAALVTVVVLMASQKASPCEGFGCQYNGTCSVSDDKAVCSCLEGFSGSMCEVTPCEYTTCMNKGTCYIKDLKPRCSCPNGFDGSRCNVTPCSNRPCLHNGMCTYSTDSPQHTCTCQAGFSGSNCEDTPCSSLPCRHNGTCIIRGSDYICTCLDGFSGSLCEDTPCSSVPCRNDGTCIISGSDYTCTCLDGFSGSLCEDTPCSSSPCINNGICIANGSNYTCTCVDGFSGPLCEESICMSSPCRNKGTCTVNGGSFTCTCTNEFTGTHCQNNVCDLDNDLNCFFTQDLDDGYDWTRRSGSTPSSNTGPPSANEGKYYFYFETSSPVASGGTARLTSRSFKIASYGCLRFVYHMYGNTMGSLKVYQNGLRLWSRHGDQGNQWHSTNVNLLSSVKTKVTFEAIKGSDYMSDIAIDYIQISSSSC